MEIANAQFDDKEKRLRKNTNQRNQYAQLTKKKKELLLQNRRQQHAQNRKRLPTDTQSKPPNNKKLANEKTCMTNAYTSESADQHIIIRANASVDQRVFNRPTSSQVAAIWCENTESEERESRDIIVYNHSGFKYMVEHYYGSHEPLPYPLLFPYGEIGWHQGIQRVDVGETQLCEGQYVMAPQNSKSASELIKKEQKVFSATKKQYRNVSCREYYCYKLQIRPNDRSILLRAGRLLQQYVVDMYVKLETSRLDYFRQNQNKIRAKVYQEIMDNIAVGETRASNVGRRIILHGSFIGGPRDMRKRYMDAITLIQKFGKSYTLLIMTCNPDWSEIKCELQLGEESQNRPDLYAPADVEIDIVDEIQQFQSVRWISASEAMWRIYRFTMSAKLALTRGRYLVLQIACFYHGATEITLKMWKFPMRY